MNVAKADRYSVALVAVVFQAAAGTEVIISGPFNKVKTTLKETHGYYEHTWGVIGDTLMTYPLLLNFEKILGDEVQLDLPKGSAVNPVKLD